MKKDFYDWYNQYVRLLVDNRYNLKGTYAWTPFGFQLQKLVYDRLRFLLEKTGHQEVRFPTLIPEDQLEKEKKHVKGFQEEVYWVTRGGANELDVPLALRPTSETAIYPLMSLWIRSHADLPMKLFQIVNTFRYETKHTRPLIRDREISFFKEAHCAHPDEENAEKEMEDIKRIYQEFFQALGVPYLIIQRPEWDKFPGAEKTISFDQVMPNAKTLQIATSHNLGTNFSEIFEMTYEKEDGQHELVHLTCHGISGRAVAGLISAHGDSKGLVLPFEFAPLQVVIVPIVFKGKEKRVLAEASAVTERIEEQGYRTRLDKGEESPGNKFFKWEELGVPVRVEVGPKEVDKKEAVLVRRDTGEKQSVSLSNLEKELQHLTNKIDKNLREMAWKKQEKQIKKVKSLEEAKKNQDKVLRVETCSPECAKKIEDSLDPEYRGSLVDEKPEGKCIACGKKAEQAGIMSNAY